MICPTCAYAADLFEDGQPRVAKKYHGECVWPESCTCQHSTDPGYVNRV